MSRVAVVMAAYNAEKTIRAAVDGLLSTRIPYDIYIVDDCSTVPVSSYMSGISDRITVLRTKQNAGPARARNEALQRVLQGPYDLVAVMDADDIAEPGRIDRQAAFMRANPDIGASGTFLREFDGVTGETTRICVRPTDPDEVRNVMFFNMGVNHASCMIRVDVLKDVGLYSEDYKAAEDYELLRRIGARYRLGNLPEVLVQYRISTSGQTHRLIKRQHFERILIQLKYFEFTQWRAWAGLIRSTAVAVAPTSMLKTIFLNRPKKTMAQEAS